MSALRRRPFATPHRRADTPFAHFGYEPFAARRCKHNHRIADRCQQTRKRENRVKQPDSRQRGRLKLFTHTTTKKREPAVSSLQPSKLRQALAVQPTNMPMLALQRALALEGADCARCDIFHGARGSADLGLRHFRQRILGG